MICNFLVFRTTSPAHSSRSKTQCGKIIAHPCVIRSVCEHCGILLQVHAAADTFTKRVFPPGSWKCFISTLVLLFVCLHVCVDIFWNYSVSPV